MNNIIVKCPDCGHEFETHDVGDRCECESCGETFWRFQNIVKSDDDETELSDHEDREPDDTEGAENVLREALGDDVVDEIQQADSEGN